MSFVNRSSTKKKTRSGIEALRKIKALSLPELDLAPASLSYLLEMLAERLMQRLRRVVQDLSAITKNGDLNVIISNGLANMLDIELLKL